MFYCEGHARLHPVISKCNRIMPAANLPMFKHLKLLQQKTWFIRLKVTFRLCCEHKRRKEQELSPRNKTEIGFTKQEKGGSQTEQCKPGESMAESGEHALVSVSLNVWVAMVLLTPSNSHEYTVGILGPTFRTRPFSHTHIFWVFTVTKFR